MIVLDTHIWIWWVNQNPKLLPKHNQIISQHQSTGLLVSVISCWEVAKLIEHDRITLDKPILEWLRVALAHPGVKLVNLTPEIVVESTQLPESFHKDPSDQIIVATARINKCPLLTVDEKILRYSHVQTL